MRLTLENIGTIKEASVELNGITVIAGENNSGKSTVGRALYSVFNSFYDIEEQVYQERLQSIRKQLEIMYDNSSNRWTKRVDSSVIAENMISYIDKYSSDLEAIKKEVHSSLLECDVDVEKNINVTQIDDTVKRLAEIFNISDEDIIKTILSEKLDAEFNGQINNIFSEEAGMIELQIKGEKVSVFIKENMITKINNNFNLEREAIYIDDPFIVDKQIYNSIFSTGNYLDHKNHLRKKLFDNYADTNIIDGIITNKKLEGIYNKINLVCNGDVVKTRNNSAGYRRYNTDKVLDIKNISTGLKTFAILKTLLQNGAIEYNGTIILDEPEIHLHPEWQLIFAELIVLIQKEFSMHILLTTHSPYFLNAIEVYSAKYEISDKCKYYLATMKNDYAYINDVSENTEAIYSKLARPLQELENERYRSD